MMINGSWLNDDWANIRTFQQEAQRRESYRLLLWDTLWGGTLHKSQTPMWSLQKSIVYRQSHRMKGQIGVKISKNLSNLFLHILPLGETPTCIWENACELFWQPWACQSLERQRPTVLGFQPRPAPHWGYLHDLSESYWRGEAFLCFNQMHVFPQY